MRWRVSGPSLNGGVVWLPGRNWLGPVGLERMVDRSWITSCQDAFANHRTQVALSQVGRIHLEEFSEFGRSGPAPVLEHGDNDRTKDVRAGPGPQCHDPAVEIQGELLLSDPCPPIRATGSDRCTVGSSYESSFRWTWLGSSRHLVIAPRQTVSFATVLGRGIGLGLHIPGSVRTNW